MTTTMRYSIEDILGLKFAPDATTGLMDNNHHAGMNQFGLMSQAAGCQFSCPTTTVFPAKDSGLKPNTLVGLADQFTALQPRHTSEQGKSK